MALRGFDVTGSGNHPGGRKAAPTPGQVGGDGYGERVTLFQPPEPPSELPPYRVAPVPPAYVRQEWPGEPWLQPWQPPPPPPPRDTWKIDRVVSIVFLALGLIGTITGVLTALLLPIGTQVAYERRGEGFFESSSSGHWLQALLWIHVLLFIAAVAITVPLLRRRTAAFYVPLIAGAIAGIVYWVVLVTYLAADHTMRFVA